MKRANHTICLKSGLQLSSPLVCTMCRRSCRFAGSRGKRYAPRGTSKTARSRDVGQ